MYAGPGFMLWLTNIFNAIVGCESIPHSFNDAIIVPVYKGKGRNPLLTTNYRGIALTSVVGKLFERALLYRMIPVLQEKNFPHPSQTAYQAGISCADATEVVQEAISSHIMYGHSAFQCFYDLEKAFGSIEYC